MIPLFAIFLVGLVVTVFFLSLDLESADESEETGRLMTQLNDAARWAEQGLEEGRR